MKTPLKIAVTLCASMLLALSLGGCGPMSQSAYLASYDRDISSSTQAIEAARDDGHRAAAYSKRGSVYSEKARYSRAFKLISSEEYGRLFGLAIQDHNQADEPSERVVLAATSGGAAPITAGGSRKSRLAGRGVADNPVRTV